MNPDTLTPPAWRPRGIGAGGIHKAALARLHSAGVAKSRRTASLPGAGGRRRPLQGTPPSVKLCVECLESLRVALIDAGVA